MRNPWLTPWLSTPVLMALSLPALAAPSWEPTTEATINLYDQGYAQLKGRDPATAEASFRKLLQSEPDCGLGMQGLGYALLFQNRSRDAKAVMQQAATLFPDQPGAWTTLSEASFASQDFKTARSAADKAIGLDPESLDAQMALQSVLLRTGDYRAAGAALDAAELHIPGPEIACLEAQLRLEQKEVAEANQLLHDCKASEREDLVTMVEGLVAQASGRTAEATQLMGALGVDTMGQVLRASDLYNHGDPAGCAKLLDDVLARSPDRLDARILRGQARAALGDMKGARQDLEVAFQGDAWVEVHSTGMMSGILRKSDEEKLQRMVIEGASLLVRILVQDEDLPRARSVLAQARKVAPKGAALDAAEAWLLSAEGKGKEGWALLSKALVSGDQDPLLREIAGQMAYKDLVDAPPVALAAIRAQGPPTARFNLASALANAKRPSDCLAEVVATPVAERNAMDAELRQRFDQLGYRCAVDSEDLDAAGARLKLIAGPASKLDPGLFPTGFNHALMLSKAGRTDEALNLLSLLQAPDARTKQKVLSLQISVLADAGRWDDALARAGDPSVDPADLAWLAGELANADRTAQASGLLMRACPALSGDAAKQCRELQTQIASGG